jgi:hypothetical protein
MLFEVAVSKVNLTTMNSSKPQIISMAFWLLSVDDTAGIDYNAR